MQSDPLPPVVDVPVVRSWRGPWRTDSQLTLAMAGSLAVTTVGVLNARRLGVPVARQVAMVALGLVALVLTTSAQTVLDGGTLITGTRIVVRTAVLLGCCALQLRLQRPWDEAFRRQGGEYVSLWKVGLIAAICGLVLEIAIQAPFEEL